MQRSIPLSSPDILEEDVQAVLDVLRDRHLSLGPRLPAFEEAVASFTGTRHAVAVNSGTSGLHLCVKAAGIGEGDEVITTPFSFVASANVMLFERAKPVFVDIDPDTYNIDLNRIEEAITPRTKAILPVHVFGRPCDMRAINEIAARHNLVVIEDACEAIGATVNGGRAGSFGQSAVFAFYPNKQMTTGEGGVVVTDNNDVAALCRSWRNQGRGEDGAWLQHERLGYNYRLSDINCALGLTQVRRLPEILRLRAHVASLYNEQLADVEELVLPAPAAPGIEVSWFVYVVRLRDPFRREDRDELLTRLRARGVACSNYFTPIHLQPFYREQFGYQPGAFPVTELASERTIALPFFNRLSAEDVSYVCDCLREEISGVSEAGSLTLRETVGLGT